MKIILIFDNTSIPQKNINIPLESLEDVCSEFVKIRTSHKIGTIISNYILEAENLFNSKVHYVQFKNSYDEFIDVINLSDNRHKYFLTKTAKDTMLI